MLITNIAMDTILNELIGVKDISVCNHMDLVQLVGKLYLLSRQLLVEFLLKKNHIMFVKSNLSPPYITVAAFMSSVMTGLIWLVSG